MSVILTTFLIAALASGATALLLLVTFRWHWRYTADDPGDGPQKLHAVAVPRVGGVAIATGLFVAIAVTKLSVAGTGVLGHALILLGALAVAFAFGLAEDVTHRVGPWSRLLATFAAALIAWAGAGLAVPRFDLALLDDLLAAHALAPMLFTLFCVGAIAHAFNLADGLNGLLAGLTIASTCTLGAVAGRHGDLHSALLAAAIGGAAVGFLVFNFPRARLFAGDAGAYLIGTAIAFLAITVVARTPAISPWLAFLAVIYPFTDTTFAIARRLAQRRGIMQPDADHLHSLLARWLGRHPGALEGGIGRAVANPLASVFILLAYAPFCLAAVAFADDSASLMALAIAFALLYTIAWAALWRAVTAAETAVTPLRAE